jgi:hypothetical protein
VPRLWRISTPPCNFLASLGSLAPASKVCSHAKLYPFFKRGECKRGRTRPLNNKFSFASEILLHNAAATVVTSCSAGIACNEAFSPKRTKHPSHKYSFYFLIIPLYMQFSHFIFQMYVQQGGLGMNPRI